MEICQDYEELFLKLNEHKIKYLVVGAHAVMYYTEPRYTKDIDVWIVSDFNDVHSIHQALKDFGAPMQNFKPDDFNNKNLIFQIGVAPVRIDILTNIPGPSFKEAWRNKVKTKYGKADIYLLSMKDLIKAKEASGRDQDKIDVKNLQKIKRPKK
ncbi:MAG: nucleotidyltransferase [Deltaproteobacteria bacterium]|nr:nucleotidyltransferase [Deltaproteobacteria bacterium]